MFNMLVHLALFPILQMLSFVGICIFGFSIPFLKLARSNFLEDEKNWYRTCSCNGSFASEGCCH